MESPEKQQKRDRIQLISTAFVLFITAMDSLEQPSLPVVIATVMGWAIGAVLVICVIRYNHLKGFMGSRFEMLLLRLTGGVFILDGVIKYLGGSRHVWILSIVLAIFYFAGLPTIIRRTQQKAVIVLDESGFRIKRWIGGFRRIDWDNVTSASCEKNLLIINIRGRKKPKTYTLDTDDDRIKGYRQAVKEISTK